MRSGRNLAYSSLLTATALASTACTTNPARTGEDPMANGSRGSGISDIHYIYDASQDLESSTQRTITNPDGSTSIEVRLSAEDCYDMLRAFGLVLDE